VTIRPVIWRRSASLGAALAILLGASIAHAQVITKTATFEPSSNLLVMSVRYEEVLDAGVQAKMLNGLETTIVTRAYIFEAGASTPIALVAKNCKVAYQLWDQVFFMQMTQPGRKESGPLLNMAGVLRVCGGLDKIPLIEFGKLTPGTTYFVQGIVEVNPISPQMLQRISKWISRPAGSTSIGPSDALFGSFVGLFANQIGKADRVVTFRTQDFIVASAPP
jgi:hypothetical protein